MRRTFRNKLYSLWDVAWIHIDRIWSTLWSRASLWLQGCECGSGLRTTGRCHFKSRCENGIRIGKNACLLAGWRSNRVGMSGPVLLTTLGEGRIDIGDDFGASSLVISSRASVTIGHDVKLGGNVRIFDHDFHSLDPSVRRTNADCDHCVSRAVSIGNDVFVGADAMILKGVKLGDRVIVGARSVVTKSFEADVVIAGNPAREVDFVPVSGLQTGSGP